MLNLNSGGSYPDVGRQVFYHRDSVAAWLRSLEAEVF